MLETFVALAEPNRLRIVALLRSGPCPVNDIGERLDLRQPQVSKHLKVLREAGLVYVAPRAQQRLYHLRPEGLRSVHLWAEAYRQLWDDRFSALDDVVADVLAKQTPIPATLETTTATPTKD